MTILQQSDPLPAPHAGQNRCVRLQNARAILLRTKFEVRFKTLYLDEATICLDEIRKRA